MPLGSNVKLNLLISLATLLATNCCALVPAVPDSVLLTPVDAGEPGRWQRADYGSVTGAAGPRPGWLSVTGRQRSASRTVVARVPGAGLAASGGEVGP